MITMTCTQSLQVFLHFLIVQPNNIILLILAFFSVLVGFHVPCHSILAFFYLSVFSNLAKQKGPLRIIEGLPSFFCKK
jgi:hypothetical protein